MKKDFYILRNLFGLNYLDLRIMKNPDRPHLKQILPHFVSNSFFFLGPNFFREILKEKVREDV